MKKNIIVILLLFPLKDLYPQRIKILPDLNDVDILLSDMTLQIEITSGIDDMYNFEFERAESQFQWLKKYYPTHPLPYFLIALNHWWKIMPNMAENQHDKIFHIYLDSAIYFAEDMFEDDETNIEAAFFLCAAYGFKARLQSERKEWIAAVFLAKKSLKYLSYSKGKENLSIEFLFGRGLYNYYAVWIRENYRFLRIFTFLFNKGNKKLGINQTKKVTREAFYTRVEGQVYLMRMYENEKMYRQSLEIASALHKKYPDNPYFHRYYARSLYLLSSIEKLEEVSIEILNRIDEGTRGYEETSGRYAAFFLGSLYRGFGEKEKAVFYFKKAVEYAEKIEAFNSGYYLFSLYHLGKYAQDANQLPEAKYHYDKLLEYGDKKKKYYKNAKIFIKDYKKKK